MARIKLAVTCMAILVGGAHAEGSNVYYRSGSWTVFEQTIEGKRLCIAEALTKTTALEIILDPEGSWTKPEATPAVLNFDSDNWSFKKRRGKPWLVGNHASIQLIQATYKDAYIQAVMSRKELIDMLSYFSAGKTKSIEVQDEKRKSLGTFPIEGAMKAIEAMSPCLNYGH